MQGFALLKIQGFSLPVFRERQGDIPAVKEISAIGQDVLSFEHMSTDAYGRPQPGVYATGAGAVINTYPGGAKNCRSRRLHDPVQACAPGVPLAAADPCAAAHQLFGDCLDLSPT